MGKATSCNPYKILLTGATGFIGSNLLPKLVDYDIKIIVRKYTDIIDKQKQILIDEDLVRFRKSVELYAPEIVLHIAAYINSNDDIPSIKNIIDSNIIFTSLLLNGLKNSPVKLFINTGTGAEYCYNDGVLNPSNFYAASKSAARYIIKYYKRVIGFKTIHIIPYSVYGGKSKSKKVIDYIIDSLNSDLPIEMTKGEQLLDFIHVDDVTDFYLHCIKNYELLIDECDYHVGTGTGTTIRELAALIENITQKKANIIWGAKPYRDSEIMKAVAPIENSDLLRWFPRVQLAEGIKNLFLSYNNTVNYQMKGFDDRK